MNDFKKWLSIPTGWDDVIIRAVKVAVVVFVILQLREWLDVGEFDTLANASDAIWIGGGDLVLNAILMWVKP